MSNRHQQSNASVDAFRVGGRVWAAPLDRQTGSKAAPKRYLGCVVVYIGTRGFLVRVNTYPTHQLLLLLVRNLPPKMTIGEGSSGKAREAGLPRGASLGGPSTVLHAAWLVDASS